MGAIFSDPNFVFYALAASATAFILAQTLNSSSSRSSRIAVWTLRACGLPAAILAVVPQVRDLCGQMPFECGPLAQRPNQVIEVRSKGHEGVVRSAGNAARGAAGEPRETDGGLHDRNSTTAPAVAGPAGSRPAVPQASKVAVAPARPATPGSETGSGAKPDAGQTQRRPQKPQTEQQQVASVNSAVAVHAATRVLGLAIGAPDPAGAAGSVAGTNDLLVLGIKAELRRLGCYAGRADGTWDKSASAAINRFNAHGHRSVSHDPDEESLAILKAFSAPVCPIASSQ